MLVFILVHYEDDTAQRHSHDGNPFTGRPGNGVYDLFKGRGKLGNAAGGSRKFRKGQKAQGSEAKEGQTGFFAFRSGKKNCDHDCLHDGGRHAALGWGARPAE